MLCTFHKVGAVSNKLHALYFNSYIYARKRSNKQCMNMTVSLPCSSIWVEQTRFTPANASSSVNDGCHSIFGVVKLHQALGEEHRFVMSATWPGVIMSSCTSMIDIKRSWDSNQKLIIYKNTGSNNKDVSDPCHYLYIINVILFIYYI